MSAPFLVSQARGTGIRLLGTGASRGRVGGRRWVRPWIILSLLLMACVACTDGERHPTQDASASEWRAGHSLLDELDFARLVEFPAHNLPRAIADGLGSEVRVEVPVPALAWQRAEAMPGEWADALKAQAAGDLWWARAPLPLVAGAQEPVARVGGAAAPAWQFGDPTPLPEGFAGWYRGQHMILAISEGPPTGVSLVGTVNTPLEFGRMERGRGVLGVDPSPPALETRASLGAVRRSAVLLPAPGVLEFPAARLVAQELHLSVGVAADAWVMQDGVVQRRRHLGDGVRFALEVVPDAAGGPGAQPRERLAPVRVWSREVLPGQVGETWLDAEVDLSPWQGERVSLRLLTEAGPGGDALHDYGMWAGLRFAGGAASKPERPHVVLIDIDTLRADRLAAYGAQREVAPGLDTWAAENAVVYTDSVSTAPWTLPSTVSLLTGLAVHQHGVDEASDALGAGADTLATLLAEVGYETHALAAGGYLRPEYGCDAGFDRYETRDAKDLDWSAALDFVAERDSERPFFLFLHSYAVHAPYERSTQWVDPAYDGVLRAIDVDTSTVFEPLMRGELSLDDADGAYIEALYDGLVSEMDRHVAEFLQQLNNLVPQEQLLVVLTSDHGEAFLDHGHLGHGVSLHGEQLRVPLVVQYPSRETGLSEVPATGVDLVPTVLTAVGVEVPEGLAGRPLQSASGGAVRVAQSGSSEWATLSDGFKLIQRTTRAVVADAKPGEPGVKVELYELATDARELSDLGERLPQQVEALRRRFEWFLGSFPTPAGGHAVDSMAGGAVLEELRALGYLGDG